MTPIRVRIRFTKEDDLRLISHRDLVRTVERLFRRGGLKLALSECCHPRPRLSFPSALALGIAGKNQLLAASTRLVSRPGKDQTVDVKADLTDLQLAGEKLTMRLHQRQGAATTRPRDVLDILQLADLEEEGCILTRTQVEAAS